MPQYMALLYNEPGDEATERERWALMPRWHAVTERLREAGVLVANAALHDTVAATTIRVRDDQLQLQDGPFATTKEILAGYYLLDCAEATVIGALHRTESRGAQYRTDYPERNDEEWLKHINLTLGPDGDPTISYSPVTITQGQPEARTY